MNLFILFINSFVDVLYTYIKEKKKKQFRFDEYVY